MQELETFSEEEECRMARPLLSNTAVNIQFGDISGDDVKTNAGSPQGDAISGTFKITLQNRTA